MNVGIDVRYCACAIRNRNIIKDVAVENAAWERSIRFVKWKFCNIKENQKLAE